MGREMGPNTSSVLETYLIRTLLGHKEEVANEGTAMLELCSFKHYLHHVICWVSFRSQVKTRLFSWSIYQLLLWTDVLGIDPTAA